MSQTAHETTDLIRERFTGRMSEQEVAFLDDLQGFIAYAICSGMSFPMVAAVLSQDINELFRFGFDIDAAKSKQFRPKVAGYARIKPDSFGQGEEDSEEESSGGTKAFVTYRNRKTPVVTIHVTGCSQLEKNGGEHAYGQGEYHSHATLPDARRYAQETKLPMKECSFCKPAEQDRSDV